MRLIAFLYTATGAWKGRVCNRWVTTCFFVFFCAFAADRAFLVRKRQKQAKKTRFLWFHVKHRSKRVNSSLASEESGAALGLTLGFSRN